MIKRIAIQLTKALLTIVLTGPALYFPANAQQKLSSDQQKSAITKPNIILVFADDLSAREFPVYGSNTWSKPIGGDTDNPGYRAMTPVLDSIATEGVFVETAWAATLCKPSRAMMMTGRYAHLHKWWYNGEIGRKSDGKTWNFYESSPYGLAAVANKGGYATYWAGKTQMSGVLQYGFDEGCLTPGEGVIGTNPYTDFVVKNIMVNGVQMQKNMDSGDTIDYYAQLGWYWKPHVQLMKHPSASADLEWWPNTQAARDTFGLNTYGPDVELDFVFDFMERKHAEGKPFFIYHTSHLGHDGWDFLHGGVKNKWPGTPKVSWNGQGYDRIRPNITGDAGVYDLHGTVTEHGVHTHVNYLDYQVWLYMNKLKELGVENNTVFIFTADNGTWGYGKGRNDLQKGSHVPLIIYAPGMALTKKGKQDILVNLSDMVPTIAEIAGVEIPETYEINGESLWPWLTTEKSYHRDYIYAYHKGTQIVRGDLVLKDGNNNWWDVSTDPDDLISFSKITDWSQVSYEHRAQRSELLGLIPAFDEYETEYDPPSDWQSVMHDPLRLVVVANGLSISEDSVLIPQYHTHQLEATVAPEDASYKELYWTSSDSSIAISSRTGLVKAISEGSAIISACELRSGLTEQVKVTVDYVPVTGLLLEPDTIKIFLKRDTTLQAAISPVNASNDSIFWSSTDPSVVVVNDKGKAGAVGIGTAAVVASSREGNFSDTTWFLVEEMIIPVAYVSLYPNQLNLGLGESGSIRVLVLPDTATNDSVIWHSSDTAIAKIYNDGTVIGVSGGTAMIYATTVDGGFTDSTRINVDNPYTGRNPGQAGMELRAYPNPAREELHLAGLPPGIDVEISLVNLCGITVLSRRISGITMNAAGNIRIPLPDIASGMYILKFSSGRSEHFLRFIKK